MNMKPGIETWLASAKPTWRVGLLSHQAALLSTGETSAQAMRRVFGAHFKALFGPEHGYFGGAAAGEKMGHQAHPLWGISVYSLYGEYRKPTPEMLEGLDFLVIDLQDLGVRCYTYLATLLLALEACEECGVQCVVCDRPIPFHTIEDGPIAEAEHFSFVAPCALPFVYGKTHTEVARWSGKPHIAAPMLGYDERFTIARPQGMPEFIPPSPAIRTWETARLYPALVFAEALPQYDIGRGSAMAFRMLSAPWINGEALSAAINQAEIPGVRAFDFTQCVEQGAIRLHIVDDLLYRPWQTACALLKLLHEYYGDDHLFAHPNARPAWMTKLCGTTSWQTLIPNMVIADPERSRKDLI
jgi:beta-N-acetylhexosaminidase